MIIIINSKKTSLLIDTPSTMGQNMTIEEINGKTDREILEIKADHVKDMKPPVRARYDERMTEIK